MQIIDISPQEEQAYFCCLEEWSPDMKDGGCRKQEWYQAMKERGLRVKLAQADNGVVGGMIQYLPIEYSFAKGKNFYFINCIWVHSHKKGRGNFRKQGMGSALLAAAEMDAQSLGADALVAWGISLPFFMRASWFRKHGYQKCDKLGVQVLLWKPFAANAEPPKLIRQVKKPEKIAGQVTVSAFINGWCPAQNIVFERAKRAAAELGDKVVFREYNTFERETFLECGISDGLFIDDKLISHGPPLKYEKIRKKIAKQLRKL